MKFSLFLLLSMLLSVQALAQETATTGQPASAAPDDIDVLITDRPDFTESAQAVPQGRVQVEAGATFERAGGVRAATFGETLLRIGTGRASELRVGVPSYVSIRDGSRSSGLDDGSLGAKFALAPGSGMGFRRPALAVIVGTSVPGGARRVAARTFAPEIKLVVAVDLNERFSFATNLGVARPTDSTARFTQFVATASFAYGVSPKVGAFLEGFAFSKTDSTGNAAQFVNTGLTYLVNPDLQFDARIGTGVGNNVGGPDYFYGIGVSRRF